MIATAAPRNEAKNSCDEFAPLNTDASAILPFSEDGVIETVVSEDGVIETVVSEDGVIRMSEIP
jgi:hypothetical protein